MAKHICYCQIFCGFLYFLSNPLQFLLRYYLSICGFCYGYTCPTYDL